MSERTVVAWDGSGPSKVALEWAIGRERSRHGTVDLVHIVDDSKVSSDYLATEAILAQAHNRVDTQALLVLREEPNVRLNTHIRRGDPYDELVELTRHDTLLIVGTSQRHGVHLRYGWSLGARLAAGAHGPVVIVPEGTAARERSGVFVGVDGTHTGNLALDFAAREASRQGETLHIVHAWTEPLAWHEGAVPDDDLVESLEIAHQSVLDETVTLLRASHPSLNFTPHLLRQDPALALLQLAESAALLVVGTRQRHGLTRAWMGSVSHAVILDIVCPTAVIAPEEHQ